MVEHLRAEAALAVAHGFDGVMTSEHHGGFAGYLPNPLQAAGWLLEVMTSGWAAPCPLLLTLRPSALVAEEVAWLAARFPGRVGVGLAAGALDVDFSVMAITKDRLAERFAAGLELVADLLAGRGEGPLAEDRALAWCRHHPVPVVSAAMSVTAVRRAARCGVGVIFDSLSTPERCRHLVDTYREAGGSGSCIVVRRAWVGQPPRRQLDDQLDVYRGYASAAAQSGWGHDEVVAGHEAAEVAGRLADVWQRTGADALNVRVHAPGVPAGAVHEQILRLGDEVLPTLRRTRPPPA